MVSPSGKTTTPVHGAGSRLPAGLLTWIHPSPRLPGLSQWQCAANVLLTALGTWRSCTAFPILPCGFLPQPTAGFVDCALPCNSHCRRRVFAPGIACGRNPASGHRETLFPSPSGGAMLIDLISVSKRLFSDRCRGEHWGWRLECANGTHCRFLRASASQTAQSSVVLQSSWCSQIPQGCDHVP